MSKGGYLGSLVLVVFCGFLAHAELRVFFTSQASIERELVHLIDQSQFSIDLALFELKSPALVLALRQAQSRGVDVRSVLDISHRDADLPAGNVRWLGGKTAEGRGVMHNKFALFDQTRVVTGSYNWTTGAEHSNYENALLTDDLETVQAYKGEFTTLWERALEVETHSGGQHPAKAPLFSPPRSKPVRIKPPKAPKKTKTKKHKTYRRV